MNEIDLATEDELSEAVAIRLIREIPGVSPGLLLRKNGNSYLRSRLRSFCEMARHRPIMVLTDLDRTTCPAVLIKVWLSRLRKPEQLLLRVAVREVESWLLADAEGIGGLLGRDISSRLPGQIDIVDNPKKLLLHLAGRAPRHIRNDLCVPLGAVAGQGLGYNSRLCNFVRQTWDPTRAAERSRSLRRTRHRLLEALG
jgi:hypothetical protein